MTKIVYQDGDAIRALKGTITHEDENFIFINHFSGEIRINKRFVVKVEE
jgi:hypothetical protein